jgi:hypothetical protein
MGPRRKLEERAFQNGSKSHHRINEIFIADFFLIKKLGDKNKKLAIAS